MPGDALIKRNAVFAPSLRFELFYALQVLSDPESRIHGAWKERAKTSLETAMKGQALPPISHTFWACFSDILQSASLDLSFDDITAEIRKLSSLEFKQRILSGLIHHEDIVKRILDGKYSLERGISKVPGPKREWLAFVKLYPYDSTQPEIQTLEAMLANPARFRETLLNFVTVFWKVAFQQTWSAIQTQYQKSIGEKERLFQICSFSEFAKQALLCIEVDEKRQVIKALRGGAEDSIARIKAYNFIPSAFNDRRLWTAFSDGTSSTVYFPYFDPAITLDLTLTQNLSRVVEPELDPALIFRALGDATRYAIVTVIAKGPKTSVELTKVMSISKSTVSQHVSLLRQAGLIDEQYVDGAVRISLRRKTVEQLSTIFFQKLDNAVTPVTLSKTRSKS